MVYKQVYTIQEQNSILKEGGEQAITKLWQAYEKQINDFVVHIMLGYGQKLSKVKIEDCQSAVKVKVCQVIKSKPKLTADFMVYIQGAITHEVEHELFGQDQIIQGERNLIKKGKVFKAQEELIRRGNLNPAPEEIFEAVNEMFGNVGKVVDGKEYPDITVKFIKNILSIKTVSLEECEEKGMQASAVDDSIGNSPEEHMEQNDFSRVVQKVFSVLDERDRRILALQEQEATQRQIAEMLGMGAGDYRFRKGIVETYLTAALLSLGYDDSYGIASRRHEIVGKNIPSALSPVMSALKEDEQRLLESLISGKKMGKGNGYTKNMVKLQNVLEYLIIFDDVFGGHYGYRDAFQEIF